MRKGTRSCTKLPISNFVSCDHLSQPVQLLAANLAIVEIPKSIQEAWRDPKWRKAGIEEMQALKKNKTWEIVQKPREKRGWALANRCYFCQAHEGSINHLLLHCEKTRDVWKLFFTVFEVCWVFLSFVWKGSFMGKKCRTI